LVLLSHVFLSLGNLAESMNMVTPAMQLASKIPDIYVRLWGGTILTGKLGGFICGKRRILSTLSLP
jgi:Cohesin loading factor